MRLLIASDHAGVELKSALIKDEELIQLIEWEDLGPSQTSSVDYPEYAHKLCQQGLASCKAQQDLNPTLSEIFLDPIGVLICGSGVGMSIAANRHPGIRAVLTWDPSVAALSREHNASNVLCLGSRFVDFATAKKTLKAWIESSYQGGRHDRRLKGIEIC